MIGAALANLRRRRRLPQPGLSFKGEPTHPPRSGSTNPTGKDWIVARVVEVPGYESRAGPCAEARKNVIDGFADADNRDHDDPNVSGARHAAARRLHHGRARAARDRADIFDSTVRKSPRAPSTTWRSAEGENDLRPVTLAAPSWLLPRGRRPQVESTQRHWRFGSLADLESNYFQDGKLSKAPAVASAAEASAALKTTMQVRSAEHRTATSWSFSALIALAIAVQIASTACLGVEDGWSTLKQPRIRHRDYGSRVRTYSGRLPAARRILGQVGLEAVSLGTGTLASACTPSRLQRQSSRPSTSGGGWSRPDFTIGGALYALDGCRLLWAVTGPGPRADARRRITYMAGTPMLWHSPAWLFCCSTADGRSATQRPRTRAIRISLHHHAHSRLLEAESHHPQRPQATSSSASRIPRRTGDRRSDRTDGRASRSRTTHHLDLPRRPGAAQCSRHTWPPEEVTSGMA